MQFNICGAICNDGKYGVVEHVRDKIVGFRPAIVTLNEVCAGQFSRLESLLDDSGWEMSGVFRPQRHDGRCPGGGFGDAVLTAGAVGRRLVLPMPNHGPEHRAVLCLSTSAAGGPVLACTLHLVTGKSKKGSQEKYSQYAAAARALNARAAGGAVIVGGDFNLVPGQMGSMLEGGRFFDVDPQAAGTHGRKIDYALFSRGHFSNPSGGPQGSKYSDHEALLGQATRR